MSETKWTPGPWDYIASTEHHGPYIRGPYGGDIADCYVMSQPNAFSERIRIPIPHQYEKADANARLIAAAPELYAALTQALGIIVEFGDLNGFRNLSDQELGQAVQQGAKHFAAVLTKARGEQP